MPNVSIKSKNESIAPGTHRIKTVELIDMTDGAAGASVVMKARRSVIQVESQSEAKRLKAKSEGSPWRNDSLGKAFANKSLRARKLKDPIAELKLFTDTITRG